MSANVTPLRIALPSGKSISALLRAPSSSDACFVLAHGAGAGMNHPFMSDLAQALGMRGIATLRFQFPYMEEGSRRPDAPAVAHEAIRAGCKEAATRLPGVPLFAGGKSFGARMTSQAQAQDPIDDVRGLIFVGFPLHPSGKPSRTRAEHLSAVTIPMLFLQGTRDALANLALIRDCTASLGGRATLRIAEGADHAFRVLVRSGRTNAQVIEELADATRSWIDKVLRP
jgi:predicted alpha/beta-hydrolase family hydrolase